MPPSADYIESFALVHILYGFGLRSRKASSSQSSEALVPNPRRVDTQEVHEWL